VQTNLHRTLNAPFTAEAGDLMNNALMVGLTRQMVLRRQMDITANNIANMSTAGFKVEKLLLQRNSSGVARNIDGPPKISFVKDTGVTRRFSDGQIEETGRAFDLAINGPGFFVIETPGGERYTRDGRFAVNDTGTLVTADGMAVLDDGGAQIILDASGEAPVIGKNGSVQVGGLEVARMDIANFEDLAKLKKVGEGRFKAPSNVEVLSVETPIVLQGKLERSNVVAIVEMSRMIETTRAYQSVSNMLNQAETLTKRTIERLGSVR
jgi:flagellar basal-body rod protein FlgF